MTTFNRLVLVLSLVLSGGYVASALDLVIDPSFNDGVSATNRAGKVVLLQWNKDAPAPVWTIDQFYSKSSVADAKYLTYRPDGFDFDDGYARISVHPPGMDADLLMGVNADKEYGGVYRKAGDPWPNLYVSQRISDPGGHLGAASPRLTELARVDFSLQVRLLYDRPHRGPGYSPVVHAAQYTLFFTLQNLNPRSKGYGDYVWFGLTVYDNRERIPQLHAMQDRSSPLKKGTEKYIYTLGPGPFANGVIGDGKWVTLQGDLLPYMLQGMQECWKHGYLSRSTDLADYRIGGLCMGWEITGLDDAAMALRGLRATATLK
jgi:hypothetical protein